MYSSPSPSERGWEINNIINATPEETDIQKSFDSC